MKTLPEIKQFCDEIKSTTSRNTKIEILKKWKTNTSVFDLLCVIYNPFLTFGVTSATIESAEPVATDRCIMAVLASLYTRQLTGNDALGVCNHVLRSSSQYKDLLCCIFNKDLKLGVDTKTINKAWGDVIPVFDVALAHDINKSPTYQKLVDTTPYVITRKLDGVRCITVINCGNITCFSRLGNEFTSLNRVKDVISSLVGNSSMVLDGELCVIDENGNENFKQAVSEIKRKDYTMENAHYKIFDMLTLDEFYGKETSENYMARLEKARTLFNCTESPFLSVLGCVAYSCSNFIKAQQYALKRNYEGLILRANAPYRNGRTADLLKVKKFQSAEYVIEDITSAVKAMKGLSGVFEDVTCMGAVVIRHKGNPVMVGSGFSDAQRIDMWNNQEDYIGKQITVKYFEESTDAYGNYSLRFPIFQGFRDIIE